MSAAPEREWPRTVLALTWLVSSALYAGITTAIFRSLIVTGFDNAIIEQVVARLSRLSAPITEVEGAGVNYFGDHFSPVLALYAPFYRVFPRPETLFIVQGAVMGLAVAVMLTTSTTYLGRRSGAFLTVLYAVSFGLLNGVFMGARETPFGVLLLTIAGACYLRGATRGLVAASLGLLLVKEDLGLTVAAIGFVLALDRHSRRTGVVLSVIGLVAFLVTVALVLPAFRSEPQSAYASGPAAMLDAASDGLGLKLLTVGLTFGVAGLAALGGRWSLVVLPTFAWRFTAGKEAYWSPLWHYSAVLMPIVFVATIAVLRHAPVWRRRSTLAVASVVSAVTLSWVGLQTAAVVDAYGSDRPVAARQALLAVPPGARVVSDEYLIGHLARNRTVYYIAYFQGCPRPEFVVVHVGPPEVNVWGGRQKSADFDDAADATRFADAAYGGEFDLAYANESYTVLQRDPSAPERPCTLTDMGSGLDSAPKFPS